MTLKKTLLAAAAAALMASPAWALPALAPASQAKGQRPSTTPDNTANPGSTHRSSEGTENTGGKGAKPNHPEGSHKCKPHKVGYVASGTLESWTLNKNTDGTYSGEVVVAVTHTNHHAKGDNAKTTKYPVAKVHVTFGGISPEALAKGDLVKVIGRIPVLAKKCTQTGTPEPTIRMIVFHPPATP
jgi:hypothetical protein